MDSSSGNAVLADPNNEGSTTMTKNNGDETELVVSKEEKTTTTTTSPAASLERPRQHRMRISLNGAFRKALFQVEKQAAKDHPTARTTITPRQPDTDPLTKPRQPRRNGRNDDDKIPIRRRGRDSHHHHHRPWRDYRTNRYPNPHNIRTRPMHTETRIDEFGRITQQPRSNGGRYHHRGGGGGERRQRR